ncbi:hypothetical protein BH10PLA2_BH10PLA2_07710 [soil metagenome]
MLKVSRLLFAGLVLLAGLPAYAADGGIEGNYRLIYFAGPNEVPLAVLKVEKKDGKLVGTVVAGGQIGARSVKKVSLDGKVLTIDVAGGNPSNFEGLVDGDTILGSFQIGSNMLTAKLVKTDEDTPGSVSQSKEFAKIDELQKSLRGLMTKVRAEKDAEKKAELQKQVTEAQAKITAEMSTVYREIIEKNPNSPAAIVAGNALLRDTKKKPTEEEARKLVDVVSAAAAKHGPRMANDTTVQLAETLATMKDLKGLALVQAKKAEALLNEKSTTEDRVRVLKALMPALKNNGKSDEAKGIETQLVKLETVLDKEYLAKVPPFKPEMFEGRKEKGDRKVVMELFTGAQCPPCVAADVAFDGLEKSYKPTEVILLQYHLHIPGPDPMTNAETEARAKYYAINSTPSTRFNGKSPLPAGGGGMAQSEGLYGRYRKVIDPILEQAAETKLTLKATKVGDKIDIKADVADLKDPGEKKRLRFVLVEETIKYVGGNKLRFHHHVVRDLPGGVKGVALNEANSKHTASVNLTELRKNLVKYLDEAAEKRPFPYADRPLDLKNLKVVALVQDDASKEILQVVQVDIDGELTTKAGH